MIVLAILAAISLAALLAWLSGDGAPADEVSRLRWGRARAGLARTVDRIVEVVG